MRNCPTCGAGNGDLAKFCSECGQGLQQNPQGSAKAAGDPLGQTIERLRLIIKNQREQIPSPTSPMVAPLMGSLKAVSEDAIAVRVGIIHALGESRDPAALRGLMLVANSRVREIRQAAALSLGKMRHSLAAYLLLPLLKDPSSRVRNAAAQGLLFTGQSFCAQAVLIAGSENAKLKSTSIETLKRLSQQDRSGWMFEFQQAAVSSSAATQWRGELVGFCQSLSGENPVQSRSPFEEKALVRDSFLPRQQTQTPETFPMEEQIPTPPASPMDQSGQTSLGSMIGPPVHFAGGSPENSGTSSVSGGIKSSHSAMIDRLSLEMDAMLHTDMDQSGERSIADLLKPTGTTDHSLDRVNSNRGTSGDSFDQFNFESPCSNSQDSSASHPSFPGEPRSFGSYNSGSMPSPGRGPSVADVRQPWPSPVGAHPAAAGFRHDSNAYMPAAGQMTPAYAGHNPYQPNGFPYPQMSPYPYPAAQFPPMAAHATPPLAMTPPTPQQFVSMDMAASSPLIPAFSSGGESASPQVSAAKAPEAEVEAKNGKISEADATLTLPPASGVTESTSESEAADRTRELNEKNLNRLREARDVAFRKLLETREPINEKPPRLLSRKIAVLLSTPSTNIEAVRKWLLEIGATASPTAIEAISSFSSKPSKEVRAACAEALGMIPHPESAVPLLKFLADKSGTVVEVALAALIRIKQPAVRGVILAAGLINKSLLSVVTSAIEDFDSDEKSSWEQFLLNACNSDDVDVLTFAISMLSRITGATHRELYEKFFSHEAPVLRAAAVEALVRTGEKRVIGHVNDALEDSDARVRSQAAIALATLHSPKSVTLLAGLFSDPDVTVRRSAAQAASRMDEPDLGEAIAKALESENDPNTVEHLLSALNRNGGDSAVSVLVRHVEGESGQFRELALKALRKLKIASSAPVFVRMLDDGSVGVRRQSVEQLAVLKQEKQLPRLREMLKRDTDETVRAACAKAIGDLQDSASLSALEEAVEDHPVVKLQAVIALGQLKLAAAGPTLLSVLKDQMPEVRYQAVKAIGQMKLDGAEGAIEELLDDSDKMVRRGAEQSLIDLGVNLGRIRSRRAKRRFTQIVLRLTPSAVAGVIPGGLKSLLAVALLMVVCIGYLSLSGLAGLFSGTLGIPDLPGGKVVGLSISSEAKIAAVVRTSSIMDVWNFDEKKLKNRLQLPPGVAGVTIEKNGGILFFINGQLCRLDPADGYSVENRKSVDVGKAVIATQFHTTSNTFCFFLPGGESTTIKVFDAATLAEKQSISVPAKLNNLCMLSADSSLVLNYDQGALTIFQLTSGKKMSARLEKMTGGKDLGAIAWLGFTGDMKYICFSTAKGFLAFEVATMKPVKRVEGEFYEAQIKSGSSDVIVSDGQRQVWLFTDSFASEKKTAISFAYNVSAIDSSQKVVAVGDQDDYDAEVFSATDGASLLKMPAEL
jgi:HEAT repeat protein